MGSGAVANLFAGEVVNCMDGHSKRESLEFVAGEAKKPYFSLRGFSDCSGGRLPQVVVC